MLGLDIGGTNIRIGLVDEQLRVYDMQRGLQQEILSGDPVSRLVRFIRAYLNQFARGRQLRAMCAGLPAIIDRATGAVLNAPNLQMPNGTPLLQKLRAAFPFPVFLEKDVHLLLLYDCHRFGLPRDGVVMACYIGTGMGNAISVDGRLLTGRTGAAGELGHIPMWGRWDPCSCGNEGCVETFAGGKYLERIQRERFPHIPVSELFLRLGGCDELEEYLEHLALPIATEINILDPDALILGGGIPSMRAFPRGRLEQKILRHVRKPYPATGLQIIYSADEGYNGIIGGALLARGRLLQREGDGF